MSSAQNAFHGIAFVKGCESPTAVGQPYNCAYSILNTVDTAHDDLKISGLADQVHSAGGDVNSGNILGALQLVFSGQVTCTGGSGSGTTADPYVGATSCTLPFGSTIATNPHSFYTVQAADFGLPNHMLTDTATLNWNDLCTGTSSNCTAGPQTITAGSSTVVQQPPSQTATSIHNAAHQVVTAVEAGSTVHDFVTVTGQPAAPVPTGSVTIAWFTNGTCSGEPTSVSGSEGLVNGQVDATNFAKGPLAAGSYSFQAHYGGDNTYQPSTGSCEPLQVVDANIQISPQTAENPVSTNHTLTAHVNVNGGAGFANAPAGTVINFTLTNSGGATAAFVGPNNCTTAGTTGSCAVVISSSTSGTTTVKASTTVTVGGVTLTRSTGDAKAGDSADATKLWANDTVRTDILNASGTVVTQVVSGTVVHDKVFVQRDPNTTASIPDPTGTVIFHRYTTADCTGTPTDQSVALTQGNPATAVSADFAPAAPTANTSISYKADYSGDANYPKGSGACEPLVVMVQPNPAIAIVKNPKTQTLPVGGTAKFTITVTNTGNTVLTNVTVTDPLSPNCNRTSAQIPALATMNPGDHVTYSCTRPNTQHDFTNQATATGTPPSGPNVTATDTAPVKVTPLKQRKVHPKVTSHKRPKATG